MSEHYTSNTESVTKYCRHCGRNTVHSVSCGRVGRCTEHEAKVRPQRPRSKQLTLFERTP